MIRPVQVVASIFVIAASVSFIGAVKAQPTRTSQPSSSQASTSPLAIKKAEEQFKNIQVLEGCSRRPVVSNHAVHFGVARG